MRLKFIALVAVAAFGLAACESAPQPETSTTGSTTTGGSTYGSMQEQLRTEVGDRIFFDFDRSDIRSDAQGTLTALAAWLNAHPEVTLTLEGHADERGTREYNLALGERRANSTRQYLISLGVDANRLAVISYGEERPEALGSDEVSWAQNRRSVFVVN